MLKHIQRIILIPPPSEEDDDKTWELFSELMSSDIELISVITEGNRNVAYLNNQQVRYFKELISALDESICVHNIDKIFKIFENVLDQTTHEGLYNLILSFFWNNKKRIFPYCG